MYQSNQDDNLQITLYASTPTPSEFTPSQLHDNQQNPPQNYNLRYKNPRLISAYDTIKPIKPMFSPTNLPLNNRIHLVRCLPPTKRDYYEKKKLYICSNISYKYICIYILHDL